MTNDWRFQVGRFVLAFGDIESLVRLCLETLPADNLAEFTRGILLHQRLQLLSAILKGRLDPDHQALLGTIQKVQQFIESRNIVAHNGLTFTMGQSAESIFLDTHMISAKDNTKRISLQELKVLSGKVEDLAMELSNNSLWLMKQAIGDQ